VRIVLLGTTMHNADSFLAEVAQLSGAAGSSSSGSSAAGGQSWTAGVDRKRIAALTSTMTSSVTSGVNSAMSKLQ
jgi:vacuolar protein sorting-associated protein 45